MAHSFGAETSIAGSVEQQFVDQFVDEINSTRLAAVSRVTASFAATGLSALQRCTRGAVGFYSGIGWRTASMTVPA